ncbi:MAG: electron transport complex subunit RsxC [Caldiserica bacterium]|nr:electron transport complex subunit RsxC [Caldisericota bacterium]
MKLFTYSPGGTEIEEEKWTKDKPFVKLPPPSIAVIPLSQHTGALNVPAVKIGDHVKIGMVIGSTSALVSAPVHASVSGDVIAIEDRLCPAGNKIQSIIIKNDFKEEEAEFEHVDSIEKFTPEELIKKIRDAGIVGLGGAAFPTSIKLSPPKNKVIETVIGNGAECEAYLTTDYRVMIEFPDEIINGILIELKILNAKRGIIAVEDNKTDAADLLAKKIAERNLEDKIEVVLLKTKYPQGSEKQLIKAVLGREIPSGGLPLDVGTVVQNVGTLKAISEAIFDGKPLIERGITISGAAIKNPGNYIVRIGTQVSEIIDKVGGLNKKLRKLVFGGPMTGIAQSSLEVPVLKGTSGILFFGEESLEMAPEEESPCIRCASCVDSCPIGLLPVFLDHAYRRNDMKLAESLYAVDCIECGACSFVCPAKRHLTENIKKAKQSILKQRKIEAAKQAAFEKLKQKRLQEAKEKEAKK